MNVKVKMPKVGRSKKGNSWSKELLMSVIGTTISIVLTFGTAHLIEQHQRKVEGREIAMMVIHDIDQYAEKFRKDAEDEAKNHDLAVYVMEHIDSIQSIPLDTIDKVVSYISYVEGNDARIDESIEKTFQSNQEIWRSIDAPSFIDEARNFFHDRRLTYQMLNTEAVFRKPINREEVWQRYMASMKTGKEPDWHGFLRNKLQDEAVILFIQLHDQRLNLLNATADSYQDMSNRCKFIMNITDDELQAFLDKRKRTGEKLTDNKLFGRWNTLDEQQQTIEFNKDHTFTQFVERRFPSPIYHGRLKITFIYTGNWNIKDDTLYRYFDAGCDFKIDRSSITCSPEKRDTVKQILKKFEEDAVTAIEKMKKQPRDTIVRAVAIDRSGNKVELTCPENVQDGRIGYLIREKATEKTKVDKKEPANK